MPLTVQPSTLFTSLSLGPVDIQPRCRAGAIYDDNILIEPSSSHPKSDLIWYAQPAFFAVAGDRTAIREYLLRYDDVITFSPATFVLAPPDTWPGATVMLDYGPRFNAFTDHSENDSADQFLTFNALWPMRKLIVGVQQKYTLQNTTIIEAGRRTWQETVPTAALAAYQFSEKTTADFKLSRTAISYEQQDLANYTDWNWDNWLNYQYTERLNLSAGVNVGLLDQASHAEQTYQTPQLRARYRYGARLVLESTAGLQMRQYDDREDCTVEPVFNASVSYLLSENTSIRLTGFRRELPSVSFGYDYIASGASLELQQQLGDRYIVSLAMTGYSSDYVATTQKLLSTDQAHRTDTFIEVKPALSIRFTRHWYGRLFYLFRTVQSGLWDGWTDNQVGSELTWTF